jgi:type II secretory pathway pseudopilin PulG
MNGGRGKRSAGYTIVETLIFLAVSSAMFVSAMALIGGRQGKADFNSSVRNFESKLQQLANEVSSGYYPSAAEDVGQIVCQVKDATGGDNYPLGIVNGMQFLTGNPTGIQGTNKDCLFLGRSIVFGSDNAASGYLERYHLLILAGWRLTGGTSGSDVTNYNEAHLAAIFPPNITAGVSYVVDDRSFGNGTEVHCVLYRSGTTNINLDANQPCNTVSAVPTPLVKVDTLSLISTFGSGTLAGGGSQVDIVVSSTSRASLGRSIYDSANEIDNYQSGGIEVNPATGVYVCLQSGGSNQFALIKLGGSSSKFTTSTTIYPGRCE